MGFQGLKMDVLCNGFFSWLSVTHIFHHVLLQVLQHLLLEAALGEQQRRPREFRATAQAEQLWLSRVAVWPGPLLTPILVAPADHGRAKVPALPSYPKFVFS